jgi:signal transduction histidine kinase
LKVGKRHSNCVRQDTNTDKSNSMEPDEIRKMTRAILERQADVEPWTDRRILAEIASRDMTTPRPTRDSLDLVSILSSDPKWEVRMVIAEGLPNFPELLFRRLAPRLAADQNSFVSRMAAIALARRVPATTIGAKSRHKGLQKLQEAIRIRHGVEASRMALNLANRQSDEYLRSVVHDLKTLLTPLKEVVRRMSESIAVGVAPKENEIMRIKSSIEDMESLTIDISNFARAVEVKKSDENVLSMISDAERNARENIEARGGCCRCVNSKILVDADLKIPVSRALFVMAITNLIKNAIEVHEKKAGFDEATIFISTRADDGVFEILICDMGGSLEESEVRKLQEFIPGGSSKPSGSGFGLPIARRHIEQNGGTLRIEPNGITGLAVIIQIPH